MKPNTPWGPSPAAAVAWSADGSPRSTQFDDIYCSREDGPGESHHVFLAGNRLTERWQHHDRDTFVIAESGFGTGLNFLLTWRAWRELASAKPRLHYISIEKFPLAGMDFSRALAQWPELSELSGQLLAGYPGLLPGQHRLLLDNGRVVLDLWWGDIDEVLADLKHSQCKYVDAWYLDGFAPARNAAMWRGSVLQSIGQLSRPMATFATFTAAGQVRRDLQAAGFAVEKFPGFGRKRECLRGTLDAGRATDIDRSTTGWDLPADEQQAPTSAVVIGAGLAGCTVAAALARRGVTVSVLDQQGLASGASANEQGILYTRLSRKHAPLTDFALQSFHFASTLYQQLFADGTLEQGADGQLCGCFHSNQDADEMAALARPLAALEDLARVVDAATASQLIGAPVTSSGYWMPRSGWMHPGGLCRALAQEENLTLLENCGRLELAPGTAGWTVLSGDKVLAEAACVVIAAGTSSAGFANLEWLPLQAIRGQTTALPQDDNSAALRAAFCHAGYIAPARGDQHCIGATFSLNDTDPSSRSADNRENLTRLAKAIPEWADELTAINPDKLDARVGFRCASPDYLPLVGRVPDRDTFLRDFAGLRQNARRSIATRGKYMPGLYLSTGHGSRGLTSTPLAAELLASMICNEPPPVEPSLQRALSPARFLIRDLSRNRI